MTPSSPSEWYDQFYEAVQQEVAPWNRFLIRDLIRELRPESRLAELGCGQGHVLRFLVGQRLIAEENIYAVDQSGKAVEFTAAQLPKAQVMVQDICKLAAPKEAFDVALLMEIIEHLDHPEPALTNIWNVLKPGGVFYLSFPNYLHLPWLLVRILAEKLNRPNWIVLQPIDRIYTVFGVIRLAQQAGFRFEGGIGSVYGPPVLYQLEWDGLTSFLNRLGLWRLSFHPILKFQKPVPRGPSKT